MSGQRSVLEVNMVQVIDAMELMKSLPDASIDLILTDPPYGNTQLAFDKNFKFDWGEFFQQAWRILKDKDRPLLMFAGGMFQAEMKYVWRKWFRYEWIWVKTMPTGFLNANRKPLNNHEYVLAFGQKGLRYRPQMEIGEKYLVTSNPSNHYGKHQSHTTINQGTRYPTTTLNFSNGNYGVQHPSQKPQELLRYLLKTYTQEGDVVLDMFCGSGSRGVAAQNLKRQYIMGELNPDYVEIAKKRLTAPPATPKKKAVKISPQQLALFGI